MEHSGVKFTSVSSENETINEGLIPKVGCFVLMGVFVPTLPIFPSDMIFF